MHTHTFWNGGRGFPESVAKWYKVNGYDFLVFTEHDVIQEGERWQSVPVDHPALVEYRNIFGDAWVEARPDEDAQGKMLVRLKALNEYRSMFEDAGTFLLMNGSEITDQHGVHILAYHVDEVIPTVGGESYERARMITDLVGLVDDYRRRSGRDTYPVLAHPNWGWNITAEMMMEVDDLRFFEIWNGVPEANNYGDDYRASTDRIWDIVLAHRLEKNDARPLYGIATDDAHDYHGGVAGRNVGQGKAWVMVRSHELSHEAILDALARGDFYASTGVELIDIQFDSNSISVEIDAQEDERYLTEFIGTRRGFDRSSSSTTDGEGNVIPNTTRSYSSEIGELLAESGDIRSEYQLAGDELYVRVRITSTADHIDPITGQVIGIQRAWVQPQVPVR